MKWNASNFPWKYKWRLKSLSCMNVILQCLVVLFLGILVNHCEGTGCSFRVKKHPSNPNRVTICDNGHETVRSCENAVKFVNFIDDLDAKGLCLYDVYIKKTGSSLKQCKVKIVSKASPGKNWAFNLGNVQFPLVLDTNPVVFTIYSPGLTRIPGTVSFSHQRSPRISILTFICTENGNNLYGKYLFNQSLKEKFTFLLSYQSSSYYSFGAIIPQGNNSVIHTSEHSDLKFKVQNAEDVLRDDSLFMIETANGENCSFLESEGRKTCFGRPNGYIFPHPTKITQYFECSGYESVLKNCSVATVYRQCWRQCAFPNQSCPDTSYVSPRFSMFQSTQLNSMAPSTISHDRQPSAIMKTKDPSILVTATSRKERLTLVPILPTTISYSRSVTSSKTVYCTKVPPLRSNRDKHCNETSVKDLIQQLDDSRQCVLVNSSAGYLEKILETQVKLVGNITTCHSNAHTKNSNDMAVAEALDILSVNITKKLERNKTINIVSKAIVLTVSTKRVYEHYYVFPNYSNADMRSTINDKWDEIKISKDTLWTKTRERRSIICVLYANLQNLLENNLKVKSEERTDDSWNYIVNSKIISASVIPTLKVGDTAEIVVRLKHMKKVPPGSSAVCAFWESSENTSYWSTKGCELIQKESNHSISVCKCNHLTNFAILLQVKRAPLPYGHQIALQAITITGSVVSLVFLSIGIGLLIFLMWGGHSGERNIIHFNLMVALCFSQWVFILGIDKTSNKTLCTFIAYLLHYLYLTCFMWMLVEGLNLYFMVVKVFSDGRSKLRYYIGGAWGIPALVVIITGGLAQENYRAEDYCWVSTTSHSIWAFVAPVMLVILFNLIILIMVMKEILKLSTSKDPTVAAKLRSGTRSALILFPLLGLTWIFGVLTFNSDLIIFQYIFAISNSLQGFFVVILHCFMNSEVRRAFQRQKEIFFSSGFLSKINTVRPSTDGSSELKNLSKEDQLNTCNNISEGATNTKLPNLQKT